MSLVIRPFEPRDLAACAAIFERLPDWFGLANANQGYLRGLSELPSFVAEQNDRVVAFASLRFHDPASAELELIAVDRPFHRQGIGGTMLAHLEEELRKRGGVRLFHVKTRGPSQPDEGYERTRHFYLAHDFIPLFETEALWGPQDPALILVKPFS